MSINQTNNGNRNRNDFKVIRNSKFNFQLSSFILGVIGGFVANCLFRLFVG